MKKLLVVIDYQKDFVDGALGFKKAETLEEGIYNKVKSYLDRGDKVVFTYDTHFENYLETREGRNLPIPHCIINSEGHDLYGRLKEFKGVKNTFHYQKRSFGIDPSTMLKITEEVGNDIEEIELVGVVSNICVISNAVTFQSQYVESTIVVDASLCASFDPCLHEEALDVLESLQAKVINRGERL
ncbi:cysteine hydrolase family protein [Inconstantimicrobium mannanitabidum]|uniref:Amidase n=1 Tax=Inconstantimicrobium mannanitabidum TaxID=1604901 RepID=A0ACB5RCW4_9CLOT|nr:isochorismatase family cysteine hydrolase [Clostridium sp. TW13]GKX67110.1 amidase [Clostridium sp. TW13]